MPISGVGKNFRDGVLLIEDDTVTPLAVTVQFEGGDFSLSGMNEGQAEVTKYEDRGVFYSARKTVQKYPAFSFTAHMTDLSDGTIKLLLDIIRKTGAFSAGVSTLGANADVWALDVTLTVAGTVHGDASDHVFVATDCILAIDFSEGDPNTFSISGEVLGTVTTT